MNYPEELVPDSHETLLLPSAGEVRVPKTGPIFKRWTGEFTGDAYGNKPILDVDGEPMFAELAILRHFQKDGWDGVWVDTFSRKYRTSWGEEGVVKLSGDGLRLLKTIHQRVGSASGCFDVFCWKGDHVLFAESKRRSKDRIRDTQRSWLEAALRVGLEPDSFLIVEWSFSGSVGSSGSDAHALTETQGRTRVPESLVSVRSGVVEDSRREQEDSAPSSASQQGWEIFFDAFDPDAHSKFLRWRERNPRAYVISRRSPNDAMLHRAYCGHFEHGDKGASLTRTMKVCSRDKGEVEGWARGNIETKLKRCRSCM